MRLHIEEPLKAATIWLTNEDQMSETAMSTVSVLIEEWKAEGYQPVIFRSGRSDLYENTAALLLNNREGAAKRAAARELTSNAMEGNSSPAAMLLSELK